MAQVRFYLKRTDTETPQWVFALYHVSGKQVKIYLDLSVRSSDWNRKSQRVKSSAINAAPINDRLSEVRRDIEMAAFRLQQQGELTPANLKSDVAGEITPKATERLTLLQYVDAWISEGERIHRPQTIKNYRTFKGHLERFGSTHESTLTMLRVDMDLVRDFADYLTNEVGLQNTSRWNILKTFKTFLGWAYEKELTKNRTFEKIRKKHFHVREPDVLRLNGDELERMARLDLESDPSLANACDPFLLQCYLGLRYDYLIKVQPDHIDGDIPRVTTEKNRKPVTIPILDEARKLLDRETPPRPILNQKYNTYIKEFARFARLNTPVMMPEFRGNKRKDVTRPKYELISTHTAKHTSVSMMDRDLTHNLVRLRYATNPNSISADNIH